MTTTSTASIAAGTTLGRYVIRQPLGMGGMGEVYEAEDTRLHRPVALKVIRPEVAGDPVRRARLEREATAVAMLNHPNIVTVHSLEEDGSTLFITMELIDGVTLADAIPRDGFPLPRLLPLAAQLADALHAAHARGIVHRDLKPANVMITRDGVVKVLDFGLSKIGVEAEGIDWRTETLTADARVVGTAPYTAPEQIEGQQADARSDMFALGVILFEMATGRRPFDAPSALATLTAILKDPAPFASDVSATVPDEISRIIDRCLIKSPARRTQSAAELRNQLEELARMLASGAWMPASAHGAAGWKRSLRRQRVARPVVWVAATMATMIVTIGIVAKNRGPSPPRIESLAVLPLENVSGDSDQEYLADGITDALITELGKIDTLRVISRTSIASYKGTTKSLPEIGRELRVDAVLEGSVVRSGNHIRITAQLLDAASDRHVWAQAFERDVHDVVTLYADVADAIGTEIHTKIDRSIMPPARARAVNPDAWALYMRGRYLWARGGAENLKKSREYFQQAIDKQPDYATAYAGLADAYLFLAINEVVPPTEAVPKAKDAALRALALDDTLAEAHTSLAGIACTYDADWSTAEREYRRALDLNPNYAIAHQWWGSTLAGVGRHAEAAVEMRRALEIDPVSLRASRAAAGALYLAREYQGAIGQYNKTLELDPNDAPALIGLGLVYTALGKSGDALAALERAVSISNRSPSALAALGHAYGLFDQRERSLKILSELKDQGNHTYVSPVDYAIVYAGLRDNDRAFQELYGAAQHRQSSLSSLKTSPAYDSLRGDPRFADLLHRVNLN